MNTCYTFWIHGNKVFRVIIRIFCKLVGLKGARLEVASPRNNGKRAKDGRPLPGAKAGHLYDCEKLRGKGCKLKCR